MLLKLLQEVAELSVGEEGPNNLRIKSVIESTSATIEEINISSDKIVETEVNLNIENVGDYEMEEPNAECEGVS